MTSMPDWHGEAMVRLSAAYDPKAKADTGDQGKGALTFTVTGSWQAPENEGQAGWMTLPAGIDSLRSGVLQGTAASIADLRQCRCLRIESSAMADCQSLSVVFLPPTVETLAEDAFGTAPLSGRLTIVATQGVNGKLRIGSRWKRGAAGLKDWAKEHGVYLKLRD